MNNGLRVAGGVAKKNGGSKTAKDMSTRAAYQGIQFLKSYGQHILKNPAIVDLDNPEIRSEKHRRRVRDWTRDRELDHEIARNVQESRRDRVRRENGFGVATESARVAVPVEIGNHTRGFHEG